jgi:hypothetical protein
MPDAVLVIESRGTADRRSIPIRRIDADAESKAWAISPATVIPATSIIGTAATVSAVEVSAEVPTRR